VHGQSLPIGLERIDCNGGTDQDITLTSVSVLCLPKSQEFSNSCRFVCYVHFVMLSTSRKVEADASSTTIASVMAVVSVYKCVDERGDERLSLIKGSHVPELIVFSPPVGIG
jgi:hypothetical protein